MSPSPLYIPARKGDIVAIEQVHSATDRIHGTSRWSEWTLGTVLSADRRGTAKEVLPAGRTIPIKPKLDVVRFFGVPTEHNAAAVRLHQRIAGDGSTYPTSEALRRAILAEPHAAGVAA